MAAPVGDAVLVMVVPVGAVALVPAGPVALVPAGPVVLALVALAIPVMAEVGVRAGKALELRAARCNHGARAFNAQAPIHRA